MYEYGIDITSSLSPQLLKSLIIEDAQHNHLRYFSPYRTRNAGAFHRNYVKIVLDLIRQAQADGEISRNVNPENAFKTFAAAIIGVGLDWSCTDGNYDEKERLKEIFEVVYHR
ncbi:MAG: hypothetical protein LUE63_09280 [Lachnospiraceae bacterium]|nr:hypothetical protein [Lachnospiraceae bacterium]